MIKIEVDEAYAYDMLSILHVKASGAYGFLRQENYLNLYSSLAEQIERHEEILKSEEYLKLIEVNKMIFNRIDEMKKSPLPDDGLYIDQMNYQRYVYKKALQEKFFPTQKLTEQKIGYDK